MQQIDVIYKNYDVTDFKKLDLMNELKGAEQAGCCKKIISLKYGRFRTF